LDSHWDIPTLSVAENQFRFANGWLLVGGIGHHSGARPGRDNATLPEPTPSHENCLTACFVEEK